MNERVIVAQANSLQVASLAQPRTIKITKPLGDQSVVVDLNHDHSAKLDLSAVANEKVTLVQVDTKLVMLFDNQSTVTADPFFDSSGKPFADVHVALSAGHGVNGEQFAQLFSITDDKSLLPDNVSPGGIPSSGADFQDVSIESMHNIAQPLALFGPQEALSHIETDVVRVLSHQNISAVVGSAPGVVIPSPGGLATQVFEAGLGARGSEPAGSHAGSSSFPTTTRAGTISFTSADAVQTVSLGGHVLTATDQTFTDATGSLTASFTYNAATGKGAIHYTYTLLDNTVGIASASFAVVVTDRDGDTNPPANLVISIVDDTPQAIADTDAVSASQATAETGNVLTGVGTISGTSGADIQGADGSLQVVGVAAGDTGADLVNVGTLGMAIVGAFGTLTLNADGSYSYLHTGAGGGNDTFTYTIKDGDGSLSHTTLTILVGDSAPGNIVIPPVGGADTTVFEAGLGARGSEPAGSHTGDPAFPATTQAGTITFTSPDGVQTVELGNLVLSVSGTPQTFSDATGSLTASFTYDAATGQGTITYTYTLLDNTAGDGSNVSFAVAVTDSDGDRTAGGNLTIAIVDDAPVAHADTDAVAAGQLTPETGNVLTGAGTTSGATGADVQGADGAVVAGVAVGNTGTNMVNAGTLGTAIVGAFGTLTLNADGSYSYVHTGSPGGGTDTFTYTIRDADGDLSHTTLNIAVADSTPGGIVIPAPGGAATTVFESGLGARGSEPACR